MEAKSRIGLNEMRAARASIERRRIKFRHLPRCVATSIESIKQDTQLFYSTEAIPEVGCFREKPEMRV